jgi:hypothetical protein
VLAGVGLPALPDAFVGDATERLVFALSWAPRSASPRCR